MNVDSYGGRDLTSPAGALSRQKTTEMQLLRTVERAARGWLQQVQGMAISKGLYLSPVDVTATWIETMDRAIDEARYLDDIQADYVATGLLQSDMPQLAYDACRTVMTMAVEKQWSLAAIRTNLREALDLDTAAPQAELTALEAAGFWDGLAAAGNRWVSNIRRTVRTTATGLDGWTTQEGIRILGIEHKRWVARMDDATRDSHAAANGQTVLANEAFLVGDSRLMYPGERGAPAKEAVSCRCVMVAVLRP